MAKEHYQLARSLYEVNRDFRRDYTIMGDVWDYRLRKMEIAWELAQRIIRAHPDRDGAWVEKEFLGKSQEVLQKANEIVDTIFSDGGSNP